MAADPFTGLSYRGNGWPHFDRKKLKAYLIRTTLDHVTYKINV